MLAEVRSFKCQTTHTHIHQQWANYCHMRPVGTFVKTTVNIKILLFKLETVSVGIVKCNVHL